MKKKQILLFLTGLLMLGTIQAQMKVSRSSALVGAKNMVITTTDGYVYNYLVSDNDIPLIQLSGNSISIGELTLEKSKIKSIRFKEMVHLLMDEDSVTFNTSATMEHGLIGLRRDFAINKWNSIILPLDLTGKQIRDAFGEDAQLAQIVGFNSEDQTIIDFQTQNLNTDDVVLNANSHYLIYPTREPDVASGKAIANFYSSRVYGPLYLIPDVSLVANQSIPRFQITTTNGNTSLLFRGTYYALDGTLLSGSTVKNKKVAPNTYTLDEDAQTFVLNEDSIIVKAFHSYIQIKKSESQNLKFCIDGIELTDGISEIEEMTDSKNNNYIFDLSGRRVAVPTRKGIYIINGKKVVIR